MMELSRLLNKEDMMTSIELCELINKFRIEEGESLKAHKRIMQDIRKELETLANASIRVNEHHLVPVEYVDKKGETRPCYKMNKYWVMQLLNKESAIVRYKTQQYIQALEEQNKLLIERYVLNAPVTTYETQMLGSMIRLQEDRQGMKKGQLKKIVIEKFVGKGTLADIKAQQYEEVCRFISSYTYLDIQIGFNLKGVK